MEFRDRICASCCDSKSSISFLITENSRLCQLVQDLRGQLDNVVHKASEAETTAKLRRALAPTNDRADTCTDACSCCDQVAYLRCELDALKHNLALGADPSKSGRVSDSSSNGLPVTASPPPPASTAATVESTLDALDADLLVRSLKRLRIEAGPASPTVPSRSPVPVHAVQSRLSSSTPLRPIHSTSHPSPPMSAFSAPSHSPSGARSPSLVPPVVLTPTRTVSPTYSAPS